MPCEIKPSTRLRALSRRSVTKSICLSFILIVFVSSGCDLTEDKALSKWKTTSSAKVLNVNVMRVTEEVTTIETSVFYGTLVPNRKSRLGFGRGGLIENALKRVGDVVKQGEVIAELQQDQLESQKRDLEQAIQDSKKSATEPQSAAANQQRLARTQQLETQLRELDQELSKGVIVAPYDCIVAEFNVEVGDLVSQQSPILQVVENVQPNVEASLPMKIVDELQDGRLIGLSFGDQAAQAKLETQSPFASSAASKKISLEIVTELVPGSWTFGQSVEIRFLLPTDNTGFWVPWSALSRESNGLWSALVVPESANLDKEESKSSISDDSTFKVARKMIELVQLEDEWALIRGAIQDGEFVIVNGLHRIVPGQRVKIEDVSGEYLKPGAGARK